MSSQDPLINRDIAGFRIEKLLGEGGMGRVYRATQLRLKRHVAVKILPHALVFKNKLFVKRFLREALTAAQVTHPNIVQVYDAGEYEGTFYIAMELVDGQGLDDILKDKQIFPLGQAIKIIIQAAQGLWAAQKKKLVHRDIKPGNLMITNEGVVKVADFGLAKNTEATHALTEAGQVLGTPAFMSPEQGKGLPADHRSDLYSLGVTLFALVTGTLPFQGETPVSIVLKHISEDIPDARERNSEIPDSLAEILLKVMEKDPEDRFQTAEELIHALSEVLVECGEESPLSGLTTFTKPLTTKAMRKGEALTTPETVDLPPGEWSEMHVPSTAETMKPGPGKRKKRPLIVAGAVGIPLIIFGIFALIFLTGNRPQDGDGGTTDGKPEPSVQGTPIRFRVEWPAEGEFIPKQNFTVTGRIESGTIQKVLINGQEAVIKDNGFSLEVALTEGERQILVLIKGKDGREEERRIPVTVDLTAPVLELVPAPGEEVRVRTPTARILGTVRDANLESVTVDGETCPLEGNRIAREVNLVEGRNTVKVEAVDRARNRSEEELVFILDTRAPVLKIADTPSILESSSAVFPLEGTADEDLSEVRVNGETVPHRKTRFSRSVSLVPGANRIVVNAKDLAGNIAKQVIPVFFRRLPKGLSPGSSSRAYVWAKDGSVMVRIPAGAFVMGTMDPPKNHDEEGPAHEVTLSEYFIDVHEVTNRQYKAFLKDVRSGKAGIVFHSQDRNRDPTPRFHDDPDFSALDQPVVGVDWYDAWAFARWAGKSLPTEAQWERAASWDAEKKRKVEYPWGSVVPNASYCNFAKQIGKTTPQSLSPKKGESPSGCRDMAGNAAEWCLDWYNPDFYKGAEATGKDPFASKPCITKWRVIRGGSWTSPIEQLRCTARRGYFPDYFLKKAFMALGFRCVLKAETR